MTPKQVPPIYVFALDRAENVYFGTNFTNYITNVDLFEAVLQTSFVNESQHLCTGSPLL